MAGNVLEALTSKFGDAIIETSEAFGNPVAVVKRDRLVEIARFLKEDEAMAFDSPIFVTCTDRLWLEDEEERPRFDVCFQIRSHRHRHRVLLKVRVGEGDEKVPSLTPVWRGFDWQERETYDMYGITFEGHPDLRRIYMYEEFVGHPLRKDYPKEKRQPLVRRDWSDEPAKRYREELEE